MGISRPVVPAQRQAFSTHAGQQIDALPDHRSRAVFCYEKARGYRNRYYEGQARFVRTALLSDDHTLRGQSEVVRTAIGQKRWSNEAVAGDLIKNEQMWTRWAMLEASMAQLDRVI